MNIIAEINKIFMEILELSDIEIKLEDQIGDIEGWDSLNHMRLITAIEEHFKIKFQLNELINFIDIQSIYDSIKEKVN